MYLLDTNIVSLVDPRRRASALPLIAWMRRNGSVLYLSAMTMAELEAGVLKLRREDKHKRADEVAGLIEEIETEFSDRILPMDGRVARAVARLQDRVRPPVVELADLIIAATADVNRLVVLTRNTRDFQPTGIAVIDPIAELPPDSS